MLTLLIISAFDVVRSGSGGDIRITEPLLYDTFMMCLIKNMACNHVFTGLMDECTECGYTIACMFSIVYPVCPQTGLMHRTVWSMLVLYTKLYL